MDFPHYYIFGESVFILRDIRSDFEFLIHVWIKGGSHMRPRTNFVLALHGECLHSNTYKNAFIRFEKQF